MVVVQTSPLYLLYVGLFIVAALACFVSLTRLQEITNSDTRRGLRALLLTSGGWATAHVGFLVSPTTSLKLGWYTLGLVVGLATVGAWLYFCSAYTGRTYHRNPTYRRLAVAVYIALIAVKVTNPLHHGYFTATAVSAPFPHLSVFTGPLHWTAMGLSYALAFIGYFMLLELFTEIDLDLDTRPLVVLVGVTGLPVVLDIIGYTTPALLDITYEPVGVAIFALGVVFVYLDQLDAVQLATERDTPVIALDADGHIRDTNRAARSLFPALATARGASLDSVFPTVTERLGHEDAILQTTQNGETRYFQLTEAPYGTAKTGLGSTLVFTDVTAREQYRQELERQNERLDDFASLVSHDLRNPLGVATGRFDLLQEELNPDNEHVAPIEAALTRIEELIEEILTLTREGQQVEYRDAVRLSSVVTRCWGMVETDGAELTIEDDLTFEADPDRVNRLFENLFRNAIEHGGPDVTVTVGVLDDRRGIYVADNGVGIPPEERENVFTAGYTTSETGTGLGLAIVAEIASAHGWAIRVTESAAGGTRFEIEDIALIE